MNVLAACISLVLPYTITAGNFTEHGTVAFRTPAECAQVVPTATPPTPQAKPPAAKSKRPARVEKAKAKKPARRVPCKPGRTRNSRGICGRWG